MCPYLAAIDESNQVQETDRQSESWIRCAPGYMADFANEAR